jgi:transposase
MLTQGEDVEAHALRERGWSISAIARHLGRDRKTVRGYLSGSTEPGVRRRSTPDPLAVVGEYVRLRFADDCHVWAAALYDEVVPLGYSQSYPSFVRQIRAAGLRPHCEACRGVKGRDTIEIDHPAGEEIQWDWFERRNAPWGATAYVLLGTLPHSGRIRGVLAERMDQAHLVEAMDMVMRRLGGTARVWRTDRLATVIVPGTGNVQPSFAPVAKHYGAIVEACPPRRGNRKGSVESSVRFCSGRWWRTMTATDPEAAQVSLDRFLATTGDARERRGANGACTTVGAVADTEPLLVLPWAPFPATVSVERTVADNATVAFRGNRYSVPPGMPGTIVEVRHRLSTPSLEVHAASGRVLSIHRLARAGSGMVIRTPDDHRALETAVLAAFSTQRPCDRKANRPPSSAALAEASRLLGAEGRDVIVDLSRYAEFFEVPA